MVLTMSLQYFKSIEQVARDEGFVQGLPRALRKCAGHVVMVNGVKQVNGTDTPDMIKSPKVLHPNEMKPYLLRANSPVLAGPISRTVTPEPVLESMGSRM